MKFLKEETITLEEKGIKITFKQVTTSVQASLITLSSDKSIVGKTKLSELILKNVIKTLEVDGKSYDPFDVATRADIADPKTLDVFYKIAAMVMTELTLSVPTKKKSIPPEEPTGKEDKPVTTVPEAKEENPEPSV